MGDLVVANDFSKEKKKKNREKKLKILVVFVMVPLRLCGNVNVPGLADFLAHVTKEKHEDGAHHVGDGEEGSRLWTRQAEPGNKKQCRDTVGATSSHTVQYITVGKGTNKESFSQVGPASSEYA